MHYCVGGGQWRRGIAPAGRNSVRALATFICRGGNSRYLPLEDPWKMCWGYKTLKIVIELQQLNSSQAESYLKLPLLFRTAN